MIDWDAARVAASAGARLVGGQADRGPRRAVVDSRLVRPGDLFVGLPGARVDGGGYAERALAAGAWGVLVAPEHAARLVRGRAARGAPDGGRAGGDGGDGGRAAGDGGQADGGGGEADGGGGQADGGGGEADGGGGEADGGGGEADGAGVVLAHPDPLAALQSLARAWRRRLGARGARVVAVTGSTGKTSTKDILAALLGAQLRTAASPANLNTEIGLPLAILGAPADTEALVLELAMRGPGQIAELAAIAEPDVGVIVNIGPVHLELLGSLEAIAAAKAELIAALPAEATVVIPADEPLLAPHLREDLDTVTFGPGGDYELATAWEGLQAGWGGRAQSEPRAPAGAAAGGPERPGEAPAGTAGGLGKVTIVEHPCEPGEQQCHIVLRPSFAQSHNLLNLLAAVAAARALGVTPHGDLHVAFSALRGERLALADEIVLINDCYNANPLSMRAALDDLAATASARRVAVLGDMLELGDAQGPALHRAVGEHARVCGVSLLVAVGPQAAAIGETFGGEVHRVPNAAAAAALLPGLLRPRDTVLVKGSRGVGLELVGQALRACGKGGAAATGGEAQEGGSLADTPAAAGHAPADPPATPGRAGGAG